jgi:hypothetical protein
MRNVVVVLTGTALLWGCAAGGQQKKPAPPAPAPETKAPARAGAQKPGATPQKAPPNKAEAKVFKAYRPYHLLDRLWTMDYAGRYVLVEAAVPSEQEAKTRCKDLLVVPGFLYTGFDRKLWYCINNPFYHDIVSDYPLPASILKRHKPASPLRDKKDAFIKYAGWFQPVDVGGLKLEGAGLRFVTALNRKVLLALTMVPRANFRPRGKEQDYGRKWPLDPKRYQARVWTIDAAGKDIAASTFQTCGITHATLRRFSDGKSILMLTALRPLPRERWYDQTHLSVWSPDGHLSFQTRVEGVPENGRDELLPGDSIMLCTHGDCDAHTPEYLKWNGKALVKKE